LQRPDAAAAAATHSADAAAAAAAQDASNAASVAELTKAGVSSAAASALVSAYTVRLPELESWARARSVTQLSEWSLRDFDFDARVTLASSSLANVRTPSLLLSLLLAAPQAESELGLGAAKPATRKLALEMSRENLDAVLAQMEKINQVVQQYSVTSA
jgi:hypothetical protein